MAPATPPLATSADTEEWFDPMCSRLHSSPVLREAGATCHSPREDPDGAASSCPGFDTPRASASGGSGGNSSPTSGQAAGFRAEVAESRLYSAKSSPCRQSDSSSSSSSSSSGPDLSRDSFGITPASAQGGGQLSIEGRARGDSCLMDPFGSCSIGTRDESAARQTFVRAGSAPDCGQYQGMGERQDVGHSQCLAAGPATPTNSQQSTALMSPAVQLRVRQGVGRSPRRGAGDSYAEGEATDRDSSSEVDYEENVAVWRETEAIARDMQQAFPGAPRAPPLRQRCCMRLLLLGQAGLGKTTFVRNLLAPYGQDAELPVADASGEAAAALFRLNPEQLATEVLVEDSDCDYHYVVQDTPGVRVEEHVGAVLSHIRAQQDAYRAAEADPLRAEPMAALPDPRVDVALLFLAPHTLRPQDVEMIVALSELVPVLPIISKADSMTEGELAAYRQRINVALDAAGKEAGRQLYHSFSAEKLAAAGAIRGVPPFAITCSSDYDDSVGRFWPVRRYPWGTCQVQRSSHSDMGVLKKLLFQVAFEELKARTEARYYAARELALTPPPSGAPSESAALNTDDVSRRLDWGSTTAVSVDATAAGVPSDSAVQAARRHAWWGRGCTAVLAGVAVLALVDGAILRRERRAAAGGSGAGSSGSHMQSAAAAAVHTLVGGILTGLGYFAPAVLLEGRGGPAMTCRGRGLSWTLE